jgi:hypothetical protein
MIHVERLRQKKMAKPKQIVNIQLKHGQVFGQKNIELTDENISDDTRDNEVLIEPVDVSEIKPIRKNIVFVDKTNDYRVNRDLVLAKLNKYTNIGVVENRKMLSSEEKSDIPFKTPIIERNDYEYEPILNANKKLFKEKIVINDEPEEEIEMPMEDIEKELISDVDIEVDESKGDAVEKEIIEERKKEDKLEKEEETEKMPKKKDSEESEEESEKEKKVTKKKERETRKIYEEPKYEHVTNVTRVGRKLISTRMPKKEKFVVRTSEYYMNNRKMYIQKIADLFRPYKKEIIESLESASCDQTQNPLVDFELLTHQKIVRDYLNLYTPYRGLLLYHGLGSGKTCTSIAIAEGMKSEKPIILLTPASLQKNFFNEIKKCGDHLYKKNQFWEFISIEGKPQYVSILSEVLQLPQEYIKRKKGAWMVDVTNKEANFTSLDSGDQMEINDQLDMMIRAKYTPINYNGIRMNNLKEWSKDFTINPFDNSTIIIEEAHNFVSRIVNKIDQPNTLSYKLYDYLMKASNAKIVLLTGTPIINYPNELGILFNILRGYIKEWTFQLNIKSSAPSNFKLNKDEIVKMFDKEGLNIYDYLEYSTNKLTITRNPYGFVNMYKKKKQKRNGGNIDGNSNNIINKITKSLFGGKNETNKRNTKKIIIKKNAKTRKQKDNTNMNTNVAVMDIEPEARIEYNDRIYIDPHEGGGHEDDYTGVSFDETGNISDSDFEKEVRRILGINHIEIIPAGSRVNLLKALPDDSESFLNMFVDKDTIEVKNENVFKKRILGLSSYFRSAQEKLLPRFIKTTDNEEIHIVKIPMSAHQFNIYERVRMVEILKEDEQKKRPDKKRSDNVGEIFKISSTYRIFSRAACNFAFPDPPGRPMPDEKIQKNDQRGGEEDDDTKQMETIKNNMNIENEYAETILDAVSPGEAAQNDEYASPEDVDNEIDQKDTNYESRIIAALKMLEESINKPPDEQILSREKLEIYSPKFLKIAENILDEEHRGLHLIYSQFRTIEGIGILRLVLKANGFAELRIRKTDSTGLWELVENPEDAGKPRFALHTGTESTEEKEIIRNIYNSNWEIVPSTITSRLREISNNNYYGEVLKVLMITASSSEGINLKNTRFVHLVEPYWHRVRIEQAIGRARRICSHQDLPEADRTVKAFLYITVFSEEQKNNKKNINLMMRDVSKIDGHPITTDESLLDTSTIKHNINKVLLNSVKETAIDCSVYNTTTNADEQLVCYGFGKVESNSFASYPEIEQDMGETMDINVRKQKLNLKLTKPINGVVYVFDPKTLDVYDKDSYDQAQQGNGELMKIGVFVKSGKGYMLRNI